MSNLNNFESCREVKWCPGCGNYAILMAIQKTFSSLGLNNDKVVFVSGIGCSGRFPYYINAHGFHTLHGRAPAIVTGLCLSREDLTVWLVIGDGDGFSIGLSHILHLVRRNINVKVLFINNKIYALTKGQYSPTSEKGTFTKSSPFGSIESSINPLLMTLSAGCTFVARVIDNDFIRFKEIVVKALQHKGTAFIEVLQNCNVFNNNIYFDISDSDNKLEKVIYLEDKKQIIFGKNKDKSIFLNDNLEFVISKNIENSNCLIHEINKDSFLQLMLAKLSFLDVIFPLGIFRAIEAETHEEKYLKSVVNNNKFSKLEDFLSNL